MSDAMKEAKFLLVDCYALAYKAFFALPSLRTSRGEPTSAVYGFANMILRVLDEQRPSHAAFFFDKGIPRERTEVYPDYKAHRERAPEDLTTQLPLLHQFVEILGFPVVEEEGVEADDLIGSAVQIFEAQGLPLLILTGDLDLLQLVSPTTWVLASKRGTSEMECYTPEKVRERYSLDPSQIPDLKGLAGDPSDNIPGVPGIGEKTAAELLREFHSVEKLLEQIHLVRKEKIRDLLSHYGEQARMSKLLATIKREIPLPLSLEAARAKDPPREPLASFFSRLEFKSLAARILGKESTGAVASGEESSHLTAGWQLEAAPRQPSRDDPSTMGRATIGGTAETALPFVMVRDQEGLSAAQDSLRQASSISLFVPPIAPPHGKEEPPLSLYISSPGREGLWVISPPALPPLLPFLAETLHRPGVSGSCHDSKWFYLTLLYHRIPFPPPIFDTFLASYLLNPLGKAPPLFELPGKRSDPVHSFEALAGWLAAAALEVSRQAPGLRKAVREEALLPLLERVELPLSQVLAMMEWEGVKVDRSYLNDLSSQMAGEMKEIASEIFSMVQEEFNLNSSRQVAHILYDVLKLPTGRKTKTGYSTDVEQLERLANLDFPAETPRTRVPRLLLSYRECSKLASTYVDQLPSLVNPRSGRVHTSYNQAVTATGRLSSSNPNLQNIPIRTEMGRRIRKGIIPEPGSLLVSADYSQIELRILAHCSKDPLLVEAFLSNQDIHARTSSELFGLSPDRVTPEMRRLAKVVNFGILYGMTEHGLAQSLGISKEEARTFIERHKRKFPRVVEYLQQIVEEATRNGWTVTILGRKRPIPDLYSRNRFTREQAVRAAINSPIQGSAADLIKLAMVKVASIIKERKLPARMIMQVHDELVFEVPREALPLLPPLIHEGMEEVMTLEVPMRVDIKAGRDWAEEAPLEEFLSKL